MSGGTIDYADGADHFELKNKPYWRQWRKVATTINTIYVAVR